MVERDWQSIALKVGIGIIASLALGYTAYALSQEDEVEMIAPRAKDKIGKVKLIEERKGLFMIESRQTIKIMEFIKELADEKLIAMM